MGTKLSKSSLLKASLAAGALWFANGAAIADTAVTLTATPTTTTLPDGQTVPMWGLLCGTVSGTTFTYAAGSDTNSTTANPLTPCTTMTGTAQTGVWQPPMIRVTNGGTLTITLVNNLSFAAGSSTNAVPTSLVIVGQVGGGLGDVTQRTTMPSPAHLPQGTTWPGTLGATDAVGVTGITIQNPGSGYTSAPNVSLVGGSGGSGATATATIDTTTGAVTGITVSGGAGYTSAPTVVIDPPPAGGTQATAIATVSTAATGAADAPATFRPPVQADRVRSFGTEVTVADGAAGKTLTWGNLRPGTYLLESGTEPSIQGPMGLYGIVVVTEPDTAAPAHQAYGTTFDQDVALLFSEIDPVQNAAVDQAVRTDGFSDALVWSAQPGKCGDPAVHNCYPPAVNYTPLYYLINGAAFDRTNSTSTALTVGGAAAQGRVLLRLVNAGLRMHVPSVVGSKLTLLAEDGNRLPGNARLQSEVLLTAGKTYDVTIQPTQQTTAGTYDAATYPVFDRALDLSTGNQRDGGMQAYINVNGGASAGAGSAASATALSASNKQFYCVAGTALAVTDPSQGVLAGAVGANGAVLGTVSLGASDTLDFHSNGTFTYASPSSATSCGGSFQFLVNGTASYTATITQCDQQNASAPGCQLAGAPTVKDVQFTSNVATRYSSPPPGVLAGVTANPGGLALTAVGAGINPDGSFVAVGPGNAGACPAGVPAGATCTQFSYQAKNAQGQLSAAANATVIFLPASNLTVNVYDAPSLAPGKTPVKVTDYRWIIEEDRTFWIDPKCQVNTTGTRLDSRGQPCPALPVESLGYNFHTANMPVVAQGCVGAISCEAGQTLGGTPAVCDVGNGICRTDAAQQAEVPPGAVHLDPSKRYFISILPGDGVNPTIGGAGGPDGNGKPFDIATACGPFDPSVPAWAPGGPDSICGHAMGGAQISQVQIASAGTMPIDVALQETPLPTAKLAVFVFQDDNPLNGENDAGGGVDVIAPNEPGLGGFNIEIFDQAGGLGDNTGQITYDMFNQPVSNSLAGKIDPITGLDSCPITRHNDGAGGNFVGMIPTCPKYESDGKTPSPLAGQAVIANLYPGLYEISAVPGADRIGAGEEWLQTNTLDGGKPHEAFIKPNEPGYFQEFGPGNFHVSIGFANPKIINARKDAFCKTYALQTGDSCTHTLTVNISNNHMSRTPDQRTFSSGNYDHYSFTNCYVSVGSADAEDFALQKCGPDGVATFANMPNGTYKIAVFDQWNDIMLDGLVGTVSISGDTVKNFPVTQWRTNLSTRTFVDANGDGVSQDGEAGLALVNTNIRYRDGSIGFFNNTDLNGYAGFNEVFPFMNWLVVETSSTRYKPEGVHAVYDAGGAVDGTTGGGASNIAAHVANTIERVPLPDALRVPGARYCASADCPAGDSAGGSSGAVFPPQPWGLTQGWQGLLGQVSFMEFAMKPYAANENGGIAGHVIYASTRPFDDPSLSLQLQWEPGVPHVQVNLYSEGVDQYGNKTLTLVDTTTTTSWDDWAQGFRRDGAGNLLTDANGNYIPNMNCPGQDATSPFFATLKDSKQWLDPDKRALANHSQFKCYDGWSQLNQIQPAPYDGMYKFPSVTAVDPTSGKPTKTNCTGCTQTDADGNPMLPPGKYVVEMIVPPGYELVKEEDKNILLGDVYIAPVTQQFAGFGNIFIMPDQAAVNAHYNPNNPGGLNLTDNLGSLTYPRHEGDTGSIETYWPCVGDERIVPDLNSLYPGAGQAAPFAGAKRPLCDRKEVVLQNQASVLAKFYVFSSTHIAGHFTGTITNDFASEFDPFSPQFGEKFGPPNLPVGLRDYDGHEVARVYSDQWGIYNGLYFSTYGVNPPNPTGYVPQMAIACMNDPGPIGKTNDLGQFVDASGNVVASADLAAQVTDPAYNPAYSNFCYETPFMPGFTAYMDTPVIPTMSFADNYNLPDAEYPNNTPAILSVNGDGAGPWVAASGGSVVTSFTVTNGGSGYTRAPAVTLSGGGGTGASGAAILTPTSVGGVAVTSAGSGYTSAPSVNFDGTGSGAAATAFLGVGSVSVTNNGQGSYTSSSPTVTVTFSAPTCAPLGTPICATATGTVQMTTSGFGGGGPNARRRVSSVAITNSGAGYTAAPTLTFSRGSATATASLGVGAIRLDNGGSGYSPAPTVSLIGGGGSGAQANATLAPTTVAAVAVANAGSGYTSAPTVNFTNTGTGGSGAAATAAIGASGQLTITALGDKVVPNPNFSGPSSTAAPYNQKTITRHYGFGGSAGTVALVDANGAAHPLTGVAWNDTTITGTVPADLPLCSASNPTYKGANANARCGELVITTADGKQSIDAITVTIGGPVPWRVTPAGVEAPGASVVHDYGKAFGRMGPSPIQTAIDSASPGDLILVAPGTYRENLIMWKPVRLQGVGAASVTVNADAHPAGKMDQWRRQVNCTFGLTLDGTTNLNDAGYAGTDPNDQGYWCPSAMHQRVDRIPFEAIVGWDASGNGNLAQVLQEPTLMGAYEGAGITVLGRGVRIPNNSTDFWGVNATGGAGAFTDGSVYLGSGDADCRASTTRTDGRDYGTSNFYCNPSRIDGVSVINSSQGGGGLFIHGWGHYLEVANTRIYGNHGTLAGGINLGNGETPDAYINDGVSCGAGVVAGGQVCPPIPTGTALNAAIPFQFNTHVRVHHNMIYDNASIGDALFSGTPAGAGAITVSAGADDYRIDHNWMAGNLSTGDGGGVQHLGLSFRGNISHNYILFNQSTNPTLPTNGGGLIVEGANLDRTLNGVECGSTNDQDCPPGLGEGAGPGIVIDANLILGNSAESGSGGGLRIQQLNGSEIVAFPTNNGQWYDVTVTNNVIANNVAGWDGGGVSIQDSLKVTFTNNTVASNDTTATAGVLFKTLGAINAASPPPNCTPTTDPTLPQNPNCTGADAPHGPQPAGLVVMANTPNLVDALTALANGPGGTSIVTCPIAYGYSGTGGVNGDCRVMSKAKIVNDLFWKNRSFSVDVVSLGSGTQSQQNLVALTPLLNQGSTGDCSTGSTTVPDTFYWDIGLRTDDYGQMIPVGTKLAVANSLYTTDTQGVVNGANNVVPGAAAADPVVARSCNGARVPPENCAAQGGQISQASCHGYNTPAGASETTSLTQLFVFNGIQPTATVDEGHNWLNLTYGPLTLSRPTAATTTPGELMISNASVGVAGGAYSIPVSSPAVGGGTASGAPKYDFFGQPRQGGIDIGAVQTGAAGSAAPTIPALTVLDTFSRTGTTLGGNWAQTTAFGTAAIRPNGSQAICSGVIACASATLGGAFWNSTTFGAQQAAAFTVANGTVSGDGLLLKATGGTVNSPASFIRVQYTSANGGTVTIAVTSNAGISFTTAGTITGFGGLASGNVLTALVDANGTVYVWKTSGSTPTLIGSATTTFTGGGRIGMQIPNNGAVDNFAGGTVP